MRIFRRCLVTRSFTRSLKRSHRWPILWTGNAIQVPVAYLARYVELVDSMLIKQGCRLDLQGAHTLRLVRGVSRCHQCLRAYSLGFSGLGSRPIFSNPAAGAW
jgi:hypothetical protein